MAPEILLALGTYLLENGLDALRSPSVQTRLHQVVDRAAQRTAASMSTPLGWDEQTHLSDLLTFVVSAGDGLPLLEQAAQNRSSVDVDELQRRLTAQGLDVETLGTPAEEFLKTLAKNFVDELLLEARQYQSPLANQVLIDSTEAIYSAVAGELSVSDLHAPMSAVSDRLLSRLRGDFAIVRQGVQEEFDEFFASDLRILVVTGRAGVGKSVETAIAVQRWRERGGTTLAVRAVDLNLSDQAEAIASRLPRPIADAENWRRVLIQPWRSLGPDDPGLLIFIDGLDGIPGDQRNHVFGQFRQLVEEIKNVPVSRVKVVLSCESNAWVHLRAPLLFPRAPWEGQDEAVASVVVDDFSESELDRALRAIGAEEYCHANRPRGMADPHIDSMREAFRHPAAFGLFAQIRAAGGPLDPTAVTTADLAAEIAEQQLAAAAAISSSSQVRGRDLLTSLARLAWAQRSPEFALSIESLRHDASFNGVDFDSTNPAISLTAALVDRGIVVRAEDIASPQRLGFRFRDVGTHFLSLHLEQLALDLTEEELRQKLNEWFEEAWEFSPLIDAIIAWANRLARSSDPGPLITIVSALVESHRLYTEVVVRLLSPHATQEFLRAAQLSEEKSEGQIYTYLKAIEAFRPTDVGLPKLRRALHEGDAATVRLAAKGLGIAGDLESVEDLAALLNHPEEQVRAAATAALAQIGAPAVPSLLAVIETDNIETQHRARALKALRAVGYRSPDVPRILDEGLKNDHAESPLLWSELLVTASALRVQGLTTHAIEALQSGVPRLVRLGADLLAALPDPAAEKALLAARDEWYGVKEAPIVLECIGKALLRLETPTARAGFLELVYSGLRDTDAVHPDETLSLIASMPSTLGRVSLIAELVRSVQVGPSSPWFWPAVKFLGNAWRPRDLSDIAAAATDVHRYGARIDERVVETLKRAISVGGGGPLTQTSFQLDVLQALVRCQIKDIGPLLCRLLPELKGGIEGALLYILWVLADSATEKPVRETLSSRGVGDYAAERSRLEIVRAMSTFATAASRNALLRESRTLTTFSMDFDVEVLVPLARRGVLTAEDLLNIAGDPTASVRGRTAAVSAVAELGLTELAPRIRGIITWGAEPQLERVCILALAQLGDQTAAPHMKERLREIADTWPPTEKESEEAQASASVAAAACLALSVLKDFSAVSLIESSADQFPDSLFDLARITEAFGRLKAPTSRPILLRLSERRESPPVIEAAIKGLGGYLPDAEAQESILTALNSGSGGMEDRGTQIAALETLAHYAPKLLLEAASNLSPIGHLDSSARQWLALYMHGFGQEDGIEKSQVVAILTSLTCDKDSWVREMVYQTIDRFPQAIVESVLASLSSSNELWRRACGVRLIGALDDDDAELEALHNDAYLLIRNSAEAALLQREERRSLNALIERFRSPSATTRTAAYFALEAQADEWTMWRLADLCPEGSLSAVLFRQLSVAIQRRRRSEHSKRGKSLDDRFTTRGNSA